MPMTHDSDLEAFKTAIDLRVYAAGLGYSLDRRESWRDSSVLRHGNGDMIIVKRDHDEHYAYFSVRDENDNGSIIDFAMQKRCVTKRWPWRVIRDLHGGQEDRFYHGYYEHYCYLPLYIMSGNHVPRARFRPANQDASAGC